MLKKLLAAILCLTAGAALAQVIPTSTLSGHVSADNAPLPGVTVTARSPALQGTRSAVTNANGDYLFRVLPPGDYTVEFAIPGFQKQTKPAKLSAAQESRVDAELKLAGVTVATTVVATRDTISTDATDSLTLTSASLEKLPTARTFQTAVALAPGAQEVSGYNAPSISGALTYENLYMINGVAIQDNIRATPYNLYIEDAVQETTTSTSGISAEYGRFAGGVINVITKSGGNNFSGSFRTTLTNDDWRALRAYTNAAGVRTDTTLDQIVPAYEATLGGPIWEDRIWFFGAGRWINQLQTAQTAAPVNATYDSGMNQKRYEGKLTISPVSNVTLVGSYIKINQDDIGNSFGTIYDLDSVYNRQTPQELLAINGNGLVTPNLLLEAQYSSRKFTFIGSGSQYTDLINGTLMIDNITGYRYWSPTFCGVCTPEKRDNQDFIFKTSFFVSAAGTHNFVLGYDRYADKRFANNYQSGSNYRIYGASGNSGVIVQNGVVYPAIGTAATGTSPSYILWTPILEGSQGNNFITDSIFLNDTWKVSSRVSVNLGIRWDKNSGHDATGNVTANDSSFSPRLGVVWDATGNGDLQVNGFYARYATLIANSIADSASIGGQPASVAYDYRGPAINTGGGALVPTAQAIQQVFDWFFANGGTSRPLRSNPTIPGLNPNIVTSLKTPRTDEFTLGVQKRLGTRGSVRVDGVYRKSSEFYAQQVDMTTGTVTGSLAGVSRTFDKALVVNETEPLERKYYGMSLNASYRVLDNLNLQGNWTWSHAYGNWDGENTGSGPITSGVLSYPEYLSVPWYAATGDLQVDRRHKVRAWAIYDVPLPWKWMVLSASWLQSWTTGTPYGGVGAVDSRPYVTNPGYITAPSSVTYYFTSRSAFRTPSIAQSDIALNIGFRPWGTVEIFIQPQVLNLFNNEGIVTVNSSIQTRVSSGSSSFAAFNPFTQTPTQGPAATGGATPQYNWNYGSLFGQPTAPSSYQTPRTFRISVGVRF